MAFAEHSVRSGKPSIVTVRDSVTLLEDLLGDWVFAPESLLKLRLQSQLLGAATHDRTRVLAHCTERWPTHVLVCKPTRSCSQAATGKCRNQLDGLSLLPFDRARWFSTLALIADAVRPF